MSPIAIRAEKLGKLYHIGRRERYRSLRETLSDAANAPWRRLRSLLRGHATGAAGLDERLWALKDVSFEIPQGEVLGIIGRNGAGKSTLLKILSRITTPTEGFAEIHGRVGSLLEVGTGFHPELTGRENLYLNGAILGMKKPEIDSKLDRIVSFAQVERFVDTPVKHYSSGMYLRLAFSVAAHLEPEILLVDEVLAVGDVEFQKRCLGKMGEVAGEGRTVVLVSHNLAAVSNLCRSAMLLDGGRLERLGPADEVIALYVDRMDDQQGVPLGERSDRRGSGRMRLERIALRDSEGRETTSLPCGAPATFVLDYLSREERPLAKVLVQIHVYDHLGSMLFTLSTRFTGGGKLDRLPARGRLCCAVASLPLAASVYTVTAGCTLDHEQSDIVDDALRFSVTPSDFFGSGASPNKQRHGSFLVPHSWAIEEPGASSPGSPLPVASGSP